MFIGHAEWQTIHGRGVLLRCRTPNTCTKVTLPKQVELEVPLVSSKGGLLYTVEFLNLEQEIAMLSVQLEPKTSLTLVSS